MRGALVYAAFDELSAEDFERSFDVSFRGVVNTVRAGLPELERSGGSLVAVVSVASKIPIPLHSPYVAAKHAVRGFLGSLRVELRHRGSRVQVSMVHPAFIGAPFFDHATSARPTRPHPLRPCTVRRTSPPRCWPASGIRARKSTSAAARPCSTV